MKDTAQLLNCRDDGRCQYAIDHGAEGMGHCPEGKCSMPRIDAHLSTNPDIAPDAPTPETDAEVIRRNYGYDRIPADFARNLERQLAAANEKVRALSEALNKYSEDDILRGR